MIRDSGVSGNGSLYNSRFRAGDVVSASQLNDLSSGLMTGTVQPYLGEGPVISYGAGGTQVLWNQGPGANDTFYFQHQVFVNEISDEEGRTFNAIQVVAGDIICQNMNQTRQYQTAYYGAYPSGMMAIGALDYSSPFIAAGGYVELADPTTGNPTAYNIYIVKNQYGIGAVGTQFSIPSVCVFALNSDAENKTSPWNENTDLQNYYDVYGALGQFQVRTTLDPLNFAAFGGGASAFNGAGTSKIVAQYNCQRVCIASVAYDPVAAVWNVTQFIQGSITIPNNLIHNGVYFYTNETDVSYLPSWLTTPDFESQEVAFEGSWDGYDKWSGYYPSNLINRGYLP